MVTELSRRTGFSGPALVRLVSQLAQVEVTEPRQSPAARLDEWLGWTESILLSKVLSAATTGRRTASAGTGTGAGSGARGVEAEKVSAISDSSANLSDAAASVSAASRDNTADIVDVAELATAEFNQLRTVLEQAVAAAVAPPSLAPGLQRRQLRSANKPVGDVDFPSYRRRYSMLQQKMESSIATLRGRLRSLLAAQSPDMARLAALDAAMEQALVGHELRLLAGVPAMLEAHFERLKGRTQPDEAGADASNWLDTFRHDMGRVMQAELSLRLQPIQGLLSAISIEQNKL